MKNAIQKKIISATVCRGINHKNELEIVYSETIECLENGLKYTEVYFANAFQCYLAPNTILKLQNLKRGIV